MSLSSDISMLKLLDYSTGLLVVPRSSLHVVLFSGHVYINTQIILTNINM